MAIQAAVVTAPGSLALERFLEYGDSAGFRELITDRMPLADPRAALEQSLDPDSGKVLVVP